VLGHLEVEKFSLFSGRSVEKYEAVVVNGDSHVKVLASADTPEDSSWPRRCHRAAGENELMTNAVGGCSSRNDDA
jgi:hypothetical protein